jgi:two-component system sensor histidine kinase/response regulator
LNKKPLILVVDDIPKNLQVIGALLNGKGYDIAFASNGVEAIQAIENTIPDLILLDIMMPEMDGFEVAERLIKNPLYSHIPIIFITGRADTSDVLKGFKVGAVDYITKPFNAPELLSRVKTHITLKTSQDILKSKNQELENTKKELQKTIASKDKFFSIIAHDLKGPFSGFIGLSSMLAEEINEFSKEEIEDMAISMNKAADRLYSLLENLLDWSRTQTGGMEYEPEKINLSEIVQNNIQLLIHNANNKKINMLSSVDNNLFVNADENMMQTILRNLISNAIKFTYADGFVKIQAFPENDFVRIIVEDSGIGMKPEIKNNLFKIEKKVSTQGTNKEKGTGLGLILCKELIEKHGGTISLESEPDVGTKFFFTIPLFK